MNIQAVEQLYGVCRSLLARLLGLLLERLSDPTLQPRLFMRRRLQPCTLPITLKK